MPNRLLVPPGRGRRATAGLGAASYPLARRPGKPRRRVVTAYAGLASVSLGAFDSGTSVSASCFAPAGLASFSVYPPDVPPPAHCWAQAGLASFSVVSLDASATIEYQPGSAFQTDAFQSDAFQ